jgi:hypothetical protein
MVEKAAAIGIRLHRPAAAVNNEAELMLIRLDFPQFLEANAIGLRVSTVTQIEFGFELLAEMAAAAFGEDVYLPCSSMPSWKFGPSEPSCRRPMSPVATPLTAPFSSNSTSAPANPG